MNKQDELGLDDRALTALLSSEREGWRYADELEQERTRLEAELAAARDEVDHKHDLIMRQGDLLRGVVNALRGPPPADTLWSHHDAPELAAKAVAELAAARAELECGHPASLMLHSAETGEPLYCELCDTRKRRDDAERMEKHYKARAEKAEAEAARLLELVTLMQERAKEGYRAWDADKDAKAGKVLAALAGLRPGYWPDMDELRAALQEGGR